MALTEHETRCRLSCPTAREKLLRDGLPAFAANAEGELIFICSNCSNRTFSSYGPGTQPCTLSYTGPRCSRRATAPTSVSASYSVPIWPKIEKAEKVGNSVQVDMEG
jgi:hypothetical protein